jgi:hypothetical protein
VTLTVADTRGEPGKDERSSLAGAATRIALGEVLPWPMPRFGVAVAPEEVPAAFAALERFRDLMPRHLLLHFDPATCHDAEALAALARLAEALPHTLVTLECVIPGLAEPALELRDIAELAAASGLRPTAVVVGPSVDRRSTPPGSAWPKCPPLDEVYRAARAAFPGVKVGGGMFSYFTELNRKPVPVQDLDFATHATCPIVHAADDARVMQTLEALPFVTRTAESILGTTPYHLGPTTIGMRQNPYGSRTMPNPDGRRIAMAADDPRQRGLFAAAWLVGYAARLAGSGVASWTGASFTGPRGLMAGTGAVVPAFHVAKGLAALSGCQRLALDSADRTRLDGFAALRPDGTTEVWVANLTAHDQLIDLGDLAPSNVSILDLDSFDAAATGPVPARSAVPATLGAYAVLRFLVRPA